MVEIITHEKLHQVSILEVWIFSCDIKVSLKSPPSNKNEREKELSKK